MSDSDSSDDGYTRKVADRILRTTKDGNDVFFLVKWKGFHENTATWVHKKKLKSPNDLKVLELFLENYRPGQENEERDSAELQAMSSDSFEEGELSRSEDDESNDDEKSHGFTDDEDVRPLIPMLKGDRVFTESEKMLSKLNTDPTIRLTRNRFNELANISPESAGAFPSPRKNSATPPKRHSRTPSIQRRTSSIPTKAKPPSKPVTVKIEAPKVASSLPVPGVPVKRGRGRPRKYPLPDSVAASALPPTTVKPVKRGRNVSNVRPSPESVAASVVQPTSLKAVKREPNVPIPKTKAKKPPKSVSPPPRRKASPKDLLEKRSKATRIPKKEALDESMMPCTSKQALKKQKKRRRIASTPPSDEYDFPAPEAPSKPTMPNAHNSSERSYEEVAVGTPDRTNSISKSPNVEDLSISEKTDNPQPIQPIKQSSSIENVNYSNDTSVEWNNNSAAPVPAYPAAASYPQFMGCPPPQNNFIETFFMQQVASQFPSATYPTVQTSASFPSYQLPQGYPNANVNMLNNNEPKPVPPPTSTLPFFLQPRFAASAPLLPPPPPPPPIFTHRPASPKKYALPAATGSREIDRFAKIFGKHSSPPRPVQPPAQKPVESLPPPSSPDESNRSDSSSPDHSAFKRSWKVLNDDTDNGAAPKKADFRLLNDRPLFQSHFTANVGPAAEARPISLPKAKDEPKSASITARVIQNSKDPRIKRAAVKEENERVQAHRIFVDCVKKLDLVSIQCMNVDKAWLRCFDSHGNTVLHALACSYGGEAAVKVLHYFVAKNFVDVDILNQSGNTPLHVALCCTADNNSMVIALLKLGADANRYGKSDEAYVSPLIFTYDRINTPAAKALLIHGANPHFVLDIEEKIENKTVPNALRSMIFSECWKWDSEQFNGGFTEKTGHLIKSSVYVHRLGPGEVINYDITLVKDDYPLFSKFNVALLEFGELGSGECMIERPPYDVFESVSLNNVQLQLYNKNATKWVFDATPAFRELMKDSRCDTLRVTFALKTSVVRSQKSMVAALLRYNKLHPDNLIVHSSPSKFG